MNNVEKVLENLMGDYEEKSMKLFALSMKQDTARNNMTRQKMNNMRKVMDENVQEEKPKYKTATAKKTAVKDLIEKNPMISEAEATAFIEAETIIEISKRYTNQEQRDLALQNYLDNDPLYNDYKVEHDKISIDIKMLTTEVDILKFKKSCINSLASIEAARLNLLAQEEAKIAALFNVSAQGVR